jgi:hypothetical protein
MTRKTTTMAGALSEMDQVGRRGHHGRPIAGKMPTSDQEDIDRAAIYRNAQTPGSLAFVEDPGPQEPDANIVLVVSGAGRVLRVALGRNRTANLIQQLVASLV